jgi:hypothetical protein
VLPIDNDYINEAQSRNQEWSKGVWNFFSHPIIGAQNLQESAINTIDRDGWVSFAGGLAPDVILTAVGPGLVSKGVRLGRAMRVTTVAGANGASKIARLNRLGKIGDAAGVGKKRNASGDLGKDEMVVADSKFLNEMGDIDWEKYAPNGGYVAGTITKGNKLPKGYIIDRYGNEYGYYAAPKGTPYTKRSLPYIKNSKAYHKYKVIKPIDNVTMGKIEKAFGQKGGGIQYELPKSIKWLKKEGYLEEIK